jgi:hypothetical protein
MVSELLGCNENEHRGGLESEYIQRLSPQLWGESRMSGRNSN